MKSREKILNNDGRRKDDLFELYRLRVEVLPENPEKPFVCKHTVGEAFEVDGENIIGLRGKKFKFSMYALAALLPLLPAKQRETHPNDWMTSENETIGCPDPRCGAEFKITRLGRKSWSHAETTLVPLNNE